MKITNTLSLARLGLVASFGEGFLRNDFLPQAGFSFVGNAELGGGEIGRRAPLKRSGVRRLIIASRSVLMTRRDAPMQVQALPSEFSVSFSGKSHELSGERSLNQTSCGEAHASDSKAERNRIQATCRPSKASGAIPALPAQFMASSRKRSHTLAGT